MVYDFQIARVVISVTTGRYRDVYDRYRYVFVIFLQDELRIQG